MSWNIIFSLLVGASAIVPIYIQDGTAKIKLQPIFISGDVREAELYTIDMNCGITDIGSCPVPDIVLHMSFLGGDGINCVATAHTIAITNRREMPNVIGIAPDSRIYGQFDNGLMLVPGRRGDDFPQDIRMFMVLNPQTPESFCQENSLFYVNRDRVDNPFSLIVETHLVSSQNPNQPPTNQAGIPFFFNSKQTLDRIPRNVFGELINQIAQSNSSLESPNIINNCNPAQYPSIMFRIGQLNGFSGEIIYSPDDYLERTSETQCTLKFETEDVEGFGMNLGRFGMNFFSKIAVHLRPDRIGFCDPADQ